VKLLATIVKESLLLCRDRAGMVILFVMPMALVLTVTLVQQEEAFKTTDGPTMAILFVDEDEGSFARHLADGLTESTDSEMVTELDGRPLTKEAALKTVARGDYQVCVIIPKGASDVIQQRTEKVITRMMADTYVSEDVSDDDGKEAAEDPAAGTMLVYFDPALRRFHRKSVVVSLQRLAQTIETKILLTVIMDVVSGETSSGGLQHEMDYSPGSLIRTREELTGEFLPLVQPTSVQQNVPAWSLFAMFLIVIPLSGSMIKERESGTFTRLQTLPVSRWTVLMGKTMTYVGVCLLQFALMLVVGCVVLPWLGTPELEMGSSYVAIGVTAVASALAATGLGILVGVVARTYEQASAFGSAFVVISAAIGGVMVPVFLMPSFMRPLCRFSPMNWGLNAFLDIFLREGGLRTVTPNILLLLVFFGGTVSLAVLCSLRRQ